MKYFDAHCHLMDDTVFLKAQEKGVSSFIVNTTQPDEWKKVAHLNQRVTGIYMCAGIHPWFIDSAVLGWQQQLCAFLERYPLAMVGEIGLDKTKPFWEQQIKIFKDCLKIASKYQRKVHIHCVNAWDEVIECISEYRNIQPLFHRFNGDNFIIQKLRFFNAYFSILNGKHAHIIPDNRLLVETDSPDGLKTPQAIPALVQSLNLDINYLNQTFKEFLNEI